MSLSFTSDSSQQADKPKWRRAANRLLTREKLIVASVLLAFLSGVFFYGIRNFESRVTFHPIRYVSGSQWTVPQGAEEVWFGTADGVRLNGWFIKSASQPAVATIIYFHGNGGNISYIPWVGRNFSTHGFDVLLFDYRGYGRSEGEVESEHELNADADAAYDYVVKDRGVNPQRLVLYGQSLGTTVATDIASRKKCGALILESGLSSAADMAAEVLPWLPRPLYALGRNRFDSAQKLKKVRVPVLVVHGDPDPVIPVEQGRRLYAAANEPKRLLIYPGAGHNVQGMKGEAYLATVTDFMKAAVQADAQR